MPAYNLNKFREPGKVFHPKEDGKAGYIIGIKGVRVYHAGDTDAIPEMKGIKADVALLPVSGTYVMTAEEAAQAAKMVEPRSEEHTSELQSQSNLVCRLLLEKKTEVLDARAPVDPAHARGQRPVGRLPGTGHEDSATDRGPRQDHLPPGTEPGSGRGAGAGDT